MVVYMLLVKETFKRSAQLACSRDFSSLGWFELRVLFDMTSFKTANPGQSSISHNFYRYLANFFLVKTRLVGWKQDIDMLFHLMRFIVWFEYELWRTKNIFFFENYDSVLKEAIYGKNEKQINQSWLKWLIDENSYRTGWHHIFVRRSRHPGHEIFLFNFWSIKCIT